MCILQREAAGQTPYLLPQLAETMADPQNGELQLLGRTLGLCALLKWEKYARHVAFWLWYFSRHYKLRYILIHYNKSILVCFCGVTTQTLAAKCSGPEVYSQTWQKYFFNSRVDHHSRTQKSVLSLHSLRTNQCSYLLPLLSSKFHSLLLFTAKTLIPYFQTCSTLLLTSVCCELY